MLPVSQPVGFNSRGEVPLTQMSAKGRLLPFPAGIKRQIFTTSRQAEAAQRPQAPGPLQIGHRATILELERVAGPGRLHPPVARGLQRGRHLTDALMTDEAIDLAAARLRTPLQIERYLTAAFAEACWLGTSSVSAEIVDAVLSRQIDDPEPVIIEHGYDVPTLAADFNCKPAEIRDLLAGRLEPDRAQELTSEMRAAGLPVRRPPLQLQIA